VDKPSHHLDDSLLREVSQRTVSHYEERVDDFWEGTRDHDVSQNIDTLLEYLPDDAAQTILDFGCGPGRDLADFTRRGHLAIGLDGCVGFCAKARAFSGCEVWHQDFLDLSLPTDRFDGVFANASLFHVPTQTLPQVLRALRNTLKPSGVLFASNPRGDDQEGWNGARYGSYHSLASWRRFLIEAGFVELTHYYRPAGKPRAEQHWLASAWRVV
jgi:SAM-dependent methyltransferase